LNLNNTLTIRGHITNASRLLHAILHGKNNFAELSKNLARSENNFV